MHQMTLHLTRWSRLWTFQLLGFVLSPVTKKATSTVSIEIHKGAIFDRLEIKIIIDIATKFEIQNCDHPTLIVLNSDWSSLGCLFSITA
jgi:hypothetical protein